MKPILYQHAGQFWLECNSRMIKGLTQLTIGLICVSLFFYQTYIFVRQYRENPTARRVGFKELRNPIFTPFLTTLNHVKRVKSISHFHQNIREIDFPLLELCFADGGYQEESLLKFNYAGIKDFVCGHSVGNVRNGWIQPNASTKQIFEESYRKPMIEELLREDSHMKYDQTVRIGLDWFEKPMVYPEGRCLVLNMTRTDHSETTLILKFENTTFTGRLELTITDPHREYYRPDIFSFSGERIIFDFSEGDTTQHKAK